MRDHGVRTLSVKPAAAAAYEAWLDARLRLMVWYEVANFWRQGGVGRVFTHYPGSVKRLWWENTWPRWEDWEGARPMRRRQRVRRVLWLVGCVLAAWWAGQNTVRGARIVAVLAQLAGLLVRPAVRVFHK